VVEMLDFSVGENQSWNFYHGLDSSSSHGTKKLREKFKMNLSMIMTSSPNTRTIFAFIEKSS